MRAEFDESLVTGNEMIDSQHKELIDKINKENSTICWKRKKGRLLHL